MIEAFGPTDVGRVRNVNQDSLLVDLDRQLFLVADGMGGHAGGEIASSLCIKSITDYLDKQSTALTDILEANDPDSRVQHLLAANCHHRVRSKTPFLYLRSCSHQRLHKFEI